MDQTRVWGVVIGAVAMMIIGFSWWGWVLGSTAESMARESANAALVTAFAPIALRSSWGKQTPQ